ncbi:MAG: hypothetical protein ACYTKC_13545 [Planctomycetota bacterium]
MTIVLVPVASAQDCTWCGFSIEPEQKVMWGKHVFCSKDCRHEWYLDRYRCKICNERVEPKRSGGTHTDGVFVYIRTGPGTWDGYCDFCREGVKNGSIDPVKDRYEPPKDDVDEADVVAAAPQVEPAAQPDADEDGSGGHLSWMLGCAVGLIFLIAKMLR